MAIRNPVYVDHDFRRVWIFGWRLHHGVVGLALIGAGLALVAHDFKDRKVWFDG